MTVRARALDVRALLEAERSLAPSNRSGVRAVAPLIVGLKEPLAAAPSPQAIEVALAVASTPPAIEHSDERPVAAAPVVAVSATPDRIEIACTSPAMSPGAAPDGAAMATARVSAPPSVSPRSQERVRRFFAGVLFMAVMTGAVVLLATALDRRGLLRLPEGVELQFRNLVQPR